MYNKYENYLHSLLSFFSYSHYYLSIYISLVKMEFLLEIDGNDFGYMIPNIPFRVLCLQTRVDDSIFNHADSIQNCVHKAILKQCIHPENVTSFFNYLRI